MQRPPVERVTSGSGGRGWLSGAQRAAGRGAGATHVPPSVRRARGDERARCALADSFINPAANSIGNGRVHTSSECCVYGSRLPQQLSV